MKTDSWVAIDTENGVDIVRKEYDIPELESNSLILAPLYGSLEGNMVHALNKEPEDIFALRQEKEIVMGNAGVMRVEKVGKGVDDLKEGDMCIYFCNGEQDKYGYPKRITGYDKKNSMGVLAKHIKLERTEVIKIPENSNISLPQWAFFSLKFITAWSNWKAAYKAFHIQLPDVPDSEIKVWGWGGGVAWAEARLAKLAGCEAGLITSKEKIIDICNEYGIDTLDRNIKNISVKKFRKAFMEKTGGEGASILIDNIGAETYQDTMRFLAREGILTTNGWKSGTMYPIIRASECISRHIHVHTHYARMCEGIEAVEYALNNDWIPQYKDKIYEFDEIPQLIDDYCELTGRIRNMKKGVKSLKNT